MYFFAFVIALFGIPFAYASPSINIDISKPLVNVSNTLWGIFFEEINHAGDGGLYAELISNRNFVVGNNEVSPWISVNDDQTTTDKLQTEQTNPLNSNNLQYLLVNGASSSCSLTQLSVANPGFHGMYFQTGSWYDLSLFLYVDGSISSITASLENSNGNLLYSSVNIDIPKYHIIEGMDGIWTKLTTSLQSNTTDDTGRLLLTFHLSNSSCDGSIRVDVISLMPRETFGGLPIRRDLAAMVQDLSPQFVRFPGGCFVEGDKLANRFNWKNAIGPIEERPGHFDLWNYFVDDGLGLYEFLAFIEKLRTATGDKVEPVWVLNNGISHSESVPVSDLGPYIQDGLDSIEFAIGDVTTKYGSIRASMGHPDPFFINYVAIGNEDCGKPWYNENYNAFYQAFQNTYPSIRLIANCDMTSASSPTQLYDFHVYDATTWFYNHQHDWDNYDRTKPAVFNSEYAVTSDAGLGNLQAAIAEAAWMTGLERNSDIVQLASYAPLFVNANDRYWNPDAIVFNSSFAYGTPSYWTQLLFANAHRGALGGSGNLVTVSTTINDSPNFSLVVNYAQLSAQGCRNEKYVIILKAVNYDYVNSLNNVNISINGLSTGMTIVSEADISVLSGPDPKGENTFNQPNAIVPKSSTAPNVAAQFTYTFPPTSLTIMRIYIAQ